MKEDQAKRSKSSLKKSLSKLRTAINFWMDLTNLVIIEQKSKQQKFCTEGPGKSGYEVGTRRMNFYIGEFK